MVGREREIKLRDFVMFQTKYRVRRLTMRQIVQCSRACKSVNIGTLDGKQSTFNKELNIEQAQLEKFEVESGVDRDTGWIKVFFQVRNCLLPRTDFRFHKTSDLQSPRDFPSLRQFFLVHLTFLLLFPIPFFFPLV